MNDDTLFALEQAIRHWKANRDAKSHYEVKLGVFACSLCNMFVDNECRGCPVATFTGAPGCSKTPYSTASFMYGKWRNTALFGEGDEKTAHEAWVAAAQAEIDFLESLLPKEKVAS